MSMPSYSSAAAGQQRLRRTLVFAQTVQALLRFYFMRFVVSLLFPDRPVIAIEQEHG
jgi:hypothetical protein